MKIKSIILTIFLMLIILPVSTSHAQDKDKSTGQYFEVEITSESNPTVTWKNWRDGDMYYGEAEIDGNKTIIVIRDGFSYSLSPDIKVARKSKLELDPEKNPMASNYGPLADIAQLNPEKYLELVKRLSGKSQGPSMMGNTPSEMYTVDVPDKMDFPWDNFKIWINRNTQLPVTIEYMEGSSKRTLNIKNVKTAMKIDATKFEIPSNYKVITFEWD